MGGVQTLGLLPSSSYLFIRDVYLHPENMEKSRRERIMKQVNLQEYLGKLITAELQMILKCMEGLDQGWSREQYQLRTLKHVMKTILVQQAIEEHPKSAEQLLTDLV